MNANDSPRIPALQREEWFHERYRLAAAQIVEFLSLDSISPSGLDVADIGCGDGIIDLGLAHLTRPASLVGFDIRPTDTALLRELAAENGLPPDLPAGLEFLTSDPQRLPAADDSFDLAISWSAFHHMQHPQSMVHEAGRILRPGGSLMIQVYPFYHSRHGSLLEPWFPEGFAQFLHDAGEISGIVRSDPGPDPAWAEAMLQASGSLNRLTLDELGRMLRLGGFAVRRIQLIGEDTRVPEALSEVPLSVLSVGGVKIIAELT